MKWRDWIEKLWNYFFDIVSFPFVISYVLSISVVYGFQNLSEKNNSKKGELQNEGDNWKQIVFSLHGFVKKIFNLISNWWSLFTTKLRTSMEKYYPYLSTDTRFQNGLFWNFLIILFILAMIQPAVSAEAKRFFMLDLLFFSCFFIICALALNLQTGQTGVVNFGVIFFVGIGAITTAILSTKFNVPPFLTLIIGMIISAFIGYILAYPSLRLRSDYFAIVTIALGEVLRITMLSEEFFQTKQQDAFGGEYYSVGIVNIESPFETRDILYPFGILIKIRESSLLPFFALFLVIVVFWFLNRLMNSPYGRVLKTIREDEDVVSAYGFDVFRYKAVILAIGGAIFALAGSLLAWKRATIFPETIAVTTTFFVWAAFIIGGKGNNKGMILGGVIIAFSQRIINRLSNLEDRSSVVLLNFLDNLFQFVIVDIGGGLFGDNTWINTFGSEEKVLLNLNFTQLLILGLIIILFMRSFKRGIIPEIPFRIETKEVEK